MDLSRSQQDTNNPFCIWYSSGEAEITFLNEKSNIISISLVLIQGNCIIISAFCRMNSSFISSRFQDFKILKSVRKEFV